MDLLKQIKEHLSSKYGMDESEQIELLTIALGSIENSLRVIDDKFTEQKSQQLLVSTHDLLGTLANIGLEDKSKQVYKIESFIKSGNLDKAYDEFCDLKDELSTSLNMRIN